MVGEKVEKIPLRHKSDKAAASRQVGEIGQSESAVADLSVQLVNFFMRQLEELVEQAQLVHDFNRRGMNRIAAKVAEEISMFFQNDDVNTGAGKQKAQHHARRAATGDATVSDKLVAVPLT